MLPPARLRSHQIVVRDAGDRQDHVAAPAVGRVHGHGPAAARGRPGQARRCWWCWTARAAPMPGGSRTGPGGCCATRVPAAWRCGPTRPPSASGRCRRASSSAPWSTSSSTAPAARRTTPTSWTLSSRWPSRLPAVRRPAAQDFLARLDPGWLTLAYSAGGFDYQLQLARAAARQVPRRRAAVPHPVPAPRPRPGRAGRLRRGRFLVLHPGGNRRARRRGSTGPGHRRPARQPCHARRRARTGAARAGTAGRR